MDRQIAGRSQGNPGAAFKGVLDSKYINIFSLNQALDNIQNIEKEKYIERVLVDLAQNEKVTVEIVNWAIAKGADVNYITRLSKNTPLMCFAGNPAVNIHTIKCLIKNGAKVGIQNKDDNTVLHLLAKNPNVNTDILDYVIDNEIDINIKNKRKESVLHLLANNEKVNSETLCEILTWAMIRGADFGARDEQGDTMLHILAYNNNVAISTLACAVKNGADFYALDRQGNSILHLLAKNQNVNTDILDFVIKNGIDINLKNNYEEVMLHLLADNENVTSKMLTWATAKGADVNAKDDEGSTPLSNLVCNPNTSVEKVKCITESKRYDSSNDIAKSNVLTSIMNDFNPNIEVFKYLASQGFVNSLKIEAEEFSDLFQGFTKSILRHFKITNNTLTSEEVTDVCKMIKGVFSSYLSNNSGKKDALIASNFKFCNNKFTTNLKKLSDTNIGELTPSAVFSLEGKKYILNLIKLETYKQIGHGLLKMCGNNTDTLSMLGVVPSKEFIDEVDFISENLKNLENETDANIAGDNPDVQE